MGSCDLLSVQCPGPTFVYPTTTCAQFLWLFTPRYMAYIAGHQTRSGDGDDESTSAKARCLPVPTSPVISDRMLETGSHHAVFGVSAVSHRKVDWQSGTWRPPGVLVLGIPHIAPGDVHMRPVWCDQLKETTNHPPFRLCHRAHHFLSPSSCPP